jgi:hypothetical protein
MDILALDDAHSNDAATAKWHPFSTVYSSPDGTGWYTMPEPGDRMRLYFPTEIDNDGYAASAVHIEPTRAPSQAVATAGPSGGSANDDYGHGSGGEAGSSVAAGTQEGPRTHPDHREISNKEGKKISLSPGTIKISGGGGSVTIEDGVGVTIASDFDINITGRQNVSIASLEGEILASGEERASVEQSHAVVELSGGKIAFNDTPVAPGGGNAVS